MSSSQADPYKALGVDREADLASIKTAYRKLVLRCHPDKVQDPTLKAIKQDEFQRVQQAYEILGDETKRKKYDDDAKLKKLREDLARGMARSATTPRASPKAQGTDYNIRTADPPPSFKPGPPPTSPFSPYAAGSQQFSHSWEHSIPLRTKTVYDEGHHARRTASYEKARDDYKDDRRRRRDDDDALYRERVRDKERERERDRDRDRDREWEKRSRSDREKDDKKEKMKRELEKREKERDRLRRQDQQEKYRARKPAYVEPYGDSDEESLTPQKIPLAGVASSGSANSKKHLDTFRRERSARRDDSPRAETSPDKTFERVKYATDYIRRRESKSGASASASASAHVPEGVVYSSNFANLDDGWRPAGDSPRSRRASQDEKKYRTRLDAADDVEAFMAPPPRLNKSYTSPVGMLHTSNSSAPRMPHLSRAATMDYGRHPPPAAPAAPAPESGRHPLKSDRHRRGSFDAYDDEPRPRRSSTQARVLNYAYDEVSAIPHNAKSAYYRPAEETYYHPPPIDSPRRSGFGKVKVARLPEQVYQTKRYSDDDITYSNVHHSSNQYSSPHASYLHVRS
ncbi:heat shock protein DNAj [Niveomyces insectorum RCEF 264]|uniref:Heat shock protein DNAj n=1 Tax=Niveomyces insectorum RCEF 264 TaxID=1081102 RepID=A0A167MT25_9HYPO|nr:heat shock protein DNAj [Niveomyces insectorum RCEF 264]